MSEPMGINPRLWRQLDRSGDCWTWTGYRNEYGYGIFNTGGLPRRVHRLVWEALRGEIPEGLELDHQCHIRACANPDHLRLVTSAQNKENRRGPQSNNKSSGVRGVTWYRRHRKWLVQVNTNGVKYHGGYHDDLLEAEKAAIALRMEVQTNNVADYARAKELGMEIDNTTGYVMPPWVPEPTPGTPAYHLIESDLRAQSEAEVRAPTSDTGERVLEFAKGRIERGRR